MCLSGDVDNILLAILLHDDIIDWRYIAWRYNTGDILLAIFCWRYFFRESHRTSLIGMHFAQQVDHVIYPIS
jgi:hypothetical protein